MDHPPYSPDLVPWGFLLCPKCKNALKGLRFTDIPGIQHNVTLLEGTPKNDFKGSFWQQHHRLMECIASQGEYFKGNRIH
jgi:hypothetical protein